jgi:Flp pilus assembly protein TadG
MLLANFLRTRLSQARLLRNRFLQNCDGGAAPFLALALIPLMGATGAAVDYSRANSVKASLQNAIDSAGLMLSKEAANLSTGELNQKATTYFNAVFNKPEVQNVSITSQLTNPQQGSFSLTLKASATVPAMFASLVGTSQIPVSATAEILWGIKKLNLALALDNTGSMSSSGKMTALKTASHNLLNTLQAAEKVPGDIKVSIVPFAVDVNVGTSNVNASWIDWTDWKAKNGNCSKSSYTSQSSCTSNNGTWTPKDKSTWNGCVNDRDQNNDALNTAVVSGSPATMYRAHQASACPAAMMPLSTDWTALHSKVDGMTPTGNTNVTIGLQMAWQTLSDNAPFNAPSPSPDLDKVIILLTDGENTQNRWTSSTSSIDARTQKACDNLKAANNVKVYTVRVINGDADLLKNCATKPEMYYDVDQAGDLNNVFSSIAQNLANLRIAK